MIIWLASYPRSGNTALRIILKRFFDIETLSQHNDQDAIGTNKQLTAVVGHKPLQASWNETYESLRNDQGTHFVKTHERPSDQGKAIYIVRDPRAVVPAYHAYLAKFTAIQVTLADVTAGAVSFGRWDHHVRAWSPDKRENTLLLTFEELTTDLQSNLSTLSDFLQQEPRKVAETSFDELRSIDPQFFSVGSNESRIKALPGDALAAIEALYADEMNAMGYAPAKRTNARSGARYIATLGPQLFLARRAERVASAGTDTLRIKNKDLNQQIAATKAALEQTKAELQRLKPLEAGKHGAERVLEFSKREIADLKSRLEARIDEAAEAARKRATLEVAAQAANERLLHAIEDKKQMQAYTEELKTELSQSREAFAMALAALERDVEDRREALEKAQTEASTQIADLNARALALEEELSGAKDTISALTQQRDADAKKAQQVSKATAHRLERRLNEKLQATDAERSRLESEQKKLKSSLQRAHETTNLYADELRHLQAFTQPRLKSILTLAPLKLVIAQRQRVQRGDIIQREDGLILPPHAPSTSEQEAIPNLAPTKPVPNTAVEPIRTVSPKVIQQSAARPSIYDQHEPAKKLGIAVFTFDRVDSVRHVLDSLKQQDALHDCHVWIDGDQGRPAKRATLDKTEEAVSEYGVRAVHRNRGNFGFRKMIIVALRKMFEQYDRVLILEDDCFPTRNCVKGFSAELDSIEDRDDIFSVYGHPFLVPGEGDLFTRFQGWGWATTREKFRPIWDELLECYLMSEEEYRTFVSEALTDDVRSWMEVTPGRSPSDTITKFFAWDETVTLLTARKKLYHRPSAERLIYNFGLGAGSTHFGDFAHYRRPPFNMVSAEDLWSVY
ncbi:MAG: sulfotransferase domain-containing protein [Pseudomonadota bacterium]